MVHWSMKEFNYAMSERVKISSENKVSLCQYDATQCQASYTCDTLINNYDLHSLVTAVQGR